MPLQIYECRNHGEFEVPYSFKEPVRPIAGCPVDSCGRAGDWKPQIVNFTVEGGTGAARGSANR